MKAKVRSEEILSCTYCSGDVDSCDVCLENFKEGEEIDCLVGGFHKHKDCKVTSSPRQVGVDAP